MMVPSKINPTVRTTRYWVEAVQGRAAGAFVARFPQERGRLGWRVQLHFRMTISKTIRGRFITLEGIDGAGKSTHLNWLAGALRASGKNVIVTREPGGTPLGEELRALLLDNSGIMHAETEALLMFAARREHLDKVILPGLGRGDWVLSDRFTDASFAYQGGGRGLPLQKLRDLELWVQEEFQPDLTLYLDVTVESGRKRTSAIKPADRFEKERDEFFQRVRDAYLERARRFPQRIRVIDANRPLEEVKDSIEKNVANLRS